VEQDPDGTPGPVTVAGYDFAAGKVAGGTPDADAGGVESLPSVPAGTPLDYFIRFDGIADGEWLKLEGFSLAMSQTGSGTIGGGGGAGKAIASDVFSLLGNSSAAVELTQAVVSGQHLKNVEIEAYQRGEDPQLVDEFKFDNALITGLNTSAHSTATAHSVSFNFAKFGHAHVEQDPDGTSGPVTSSGWDFAANKSVGGPDGKEGADGAPFVDAPIKANLDYYFTFEGAEGWLKLDSFSMGITQSGSGIIGGGGGAGKAVASDVFLVLGSSSEIVDITDFLLSGAHLKNVEIEAYRGEDPQLVDEYRFEDVLFSSWSNSNASANAVSFNYAKFSHAHVEQDPDGTPGPVTVAGYDFAAAKNFSSLLPDADVFS
jgi:type VI protein secretion system component Hcp